MTGAVVIEPRFNGPPGSANGGYACGLVAEALGAGPARVSLRSPPPLGIPLERRREADGTVTLLDGAAVVAVGAPATLDLRPPAAPSVADADRAAAGYAGHHEHPFPTCFVCGPRRVQGDGLRIFAGPLEGAPATAEEGRVVAAAWPAPDAVDGRLVWAALDCPSAYACAWRGPAVLASLTAQQLATVEPGRPHVVVAWPLGRDGRKHRAGSALLRADGEPVAIAEALWIELKDPSSFGVGG